jgi:hypothetical protein
MNDILKDLYEMEAPSKLLLNYLPPSTRKQRITWTVKRYLTNLWFAFKGNK